MQPRTGGSVGRNQQGKVNRGESWSDQPYFLVPPIAYSMLPRGGVSEKWNVRAFVTMAGHQWKCNDEKYWAKIKLLQNCEPKNIFRWRWAPAWMLFDESATARRWARHVPLHWAFKGFVKKHYQWVIEQHLRRPIRGE